MELNNKGESIKTLISNALSSLKLTLCHRSSQQFYIPRQRELNV